MYISKVEKVECREVIKFLVWMVLEISMQTVVSRQETKKCKSAVSSMRINKSRSLTIFLRE